MTTPTTKQLNRYYQDEVKLSRENTKDVVKRVIPAVTDILRYINKQDSRFDIQPHFIGSYWQVLKVEKADEFDINVPVLGCPDLYHTSGTPRYFGFSKDNVPDPTPTIDGTLEIVKRRLPLPSPKSGYITVKLGNTPNNWKEFTDTWMFDGYLIPFLVKKTFHRHLTNAIRDLDLRDGARMRKLCAGPSLTVHVYVDGSTIDLDFAPTLEAIIDWPVKWPKQPVSWPSTDKIAAVRQTRLSNVPSKNFDWWESYAAADHELFDNIDQDGGCRKQCLRMMKKLRDDVWCPTTKPVITSYHLKNILWWECQDYPRSSQWTNDNLPTRFMSLVRRLLDCTESRELKFYFNQNVNLISQKRVDDLDIAARKIRKFLDNPVKFLSSDLADSGYGGSPWSSRIGSLSP